MRPGRWLLVAVVLAAGCGGGGDDRPPADPLSYLPADAGAVAVVDVDSDDAPEVGGRPLKEVVADAAGAPNWGVLEVLVGDELIVGTLGPVTGSQFVGAIALDDEASMRGALDRGGYSKRGEEQGADVFEGGGPPVAVEDGMLILAYARPALSRALLVHDAPAAERFARPRLDRATGVLPSGAPVRGYAGPLGPFRGGGLTARASGPEVTVDAEFATAGLARRSIPDLADALAAQGATVTRTPRGFDFRATAALRTLAQRLTGFDPGPEAAIGGGVTADRDRLRGTARVQLP